MCDIISLKGDENMSKGEKYIGLTRYLKECEKDTITLSFEEIVKIIGEELPPSKQYTEFWSNSRSHSVAFGWLNASYKTTDLRNNISNKRMVFIKK